MLYCKPNKPRGEKQNLYMKFLKWPSFSTIYVCFKMTVLFKMALTMSFLALNLHGLVFFVISLRKKKKKKGWLRNGSPDFWSLARAKWDSATAERAGCTGLTWRCSSYQGAVDKLKDNLQREIYIILRGGIWGWGISWQKIVVVVVVAVVVVLVAKTTTHSLRILYNVLC